MKETKVVLDTQGEVRLCYDPEMNEIYFEWFSFFGIWERFELEDHQIPDFNEYPDALTLDFTGKTVMIVELVGYGPMQLRINDLPLTKKLISLALVEMEKIKGDNLVESYDEEEGEHLEAILYGSDYKEEDYDESNRGN